jgi:hypothetical protein
LFGVLAPVTKTEMVQVPLKTFNHMDYLWAKNAKELVYDKIVTFLARDDAKAEKNQMRELDQVTFSNNLL